MTEMTYNSLLDDLRRYADRSDAPFNTQLPRLISLAEHRIATEVRGLGFLRSVTSTMVQGNPVLVKPERWRETISFNFGADNSAARRNFLRLRSYEYCRLYWPAPTATGTPKYWADYDYEHFLLAPTPDSAYAYELTYHEKPDPLSDENQRNWTTEYAPQLMLYAALLEAQPFLRLPERIPEFQAMYDSAKGAIMGEEVRRVTSKNQAINR